MHSLWVCVEFEWMAMGERFGPNIKLDLWSPKRPGDIPEKRRAPKSAHVNFGFAGSCELWHCWYFSSFQRCLCTWDLSESIQIHANRIHHLVSESIEHFSVSIPITVAEAIVPQHSRSLIVSAKLSITNWCCNKMAISSKLLSIICILTAGTFSRQCAAQQINTASYRYDVPPRGAPPRLSTSKSRSVSRLRTSIARAVKGCLKIPVRRADELQKLTMPFRFLGHIYGQHRVTQLYLRARRTTPNEQICHLCRRVRTPLIPTPANHGGHQKIYATHFNVCIHLHNLRNWAVWMVEKASRHPQRWTTSFCCEQCMN